mmetsp:Transcript_52035/g.122117  ORF Transcript_52035/g.122117 Transcript_52035/m.122117 type:complete len:240 (-) Transcript_52035:96-815(-)
MAPSMSSRCSRISCPMRPGKCIGTRSSTSARHSHTSPKLSLTAGRPGVRGVLTGEFERDRVSSARARSARDGDGKRGALASSSTAASTSSSAAQLSTMAALVLSLARLTASSFPFAVSHTSSDSSTTSRRPLCSAVRHDCSMADRLQECSSCWMSIAWLSSSCMIRSLNCSVVVPSSSTRERFGLDIGLVAITSSDLAASPAILLSSLLAWFIARTAWSARSRWSDNCASSICIRETAA